MMKNNISSMIHGIIYIFMSIGLACGQTACSAEKQNPPATQISTQNETKVERVNTPIPAHSAEKTAAPSPTSGSEKETENGAAESGNIVITFAEWELFKPFYEPLMEEFHRENPSITVHFVNSPEFQNADNIDELKIIRAFASSADTIVIGGRLGRLDNENTYFHDLQPQIDKDGELNPEDFWPGALTGCQDSQGHTLGLPYHLYLRGVFFDEQAFQDAGLPFPKPGWTWDDFRKDTAALAQQKQGAIRYGFADTNETILSPLLEQRLAKTNGDIPIQTIADDLQWYLDLASQKSLYPIQDAVGNEAEHQAHERWHTMFRGNNKRPAMWDEGVQSPDPALKTDPSEVLTEDEDPSTHLAINRFGLAPFPAATDGSHINNTPIYVNCVAISAGSAHIQAAYAWAKFLTQHPPAGDRTFPSEQVTVPARQSVTDKIGFWDVLPSKIKTSVRYILEHGWYSGLYPSSVETISSALRKSAAGNTDFVAALTTAKAELAKTPQATPDTRPIIINGAAK
jgi:ABC-type glycerol-3-phosphate transport system substrate-binding protein